jgi:hypothetical protein
MEVDNPSSILGAYPMLLREINRVIGIGNLLTCSLDNEIISLHYGLL